MLERPTTGETGVTIVEMVVVLAVVTILAGTAVPLVSVLVDAERRSDVRLELDHVAAALEEFYYDHAAFPPALDDAGFLGPYLQPGVNGTAIQDGWGGDAHYAYAVLTGPDRAAVHSRGENGIDEGYGHEDLRVMVYGAVPGTRKTRARMRVIVEALATFLEAGGSVSGDWAADRAALGLGDPYHDDGFGTAFSLSPTTLVLRSAGPDRISGNADDITS